MNRVLPANSRVLRLLVPVVVGLLCGCQGEGAGPQAGGKPGGLTMDLAQTHEQLRRWHAQRSYLAMRPYVDPVQRDDLIDLLVAMDSLLTANQVAQQAVRQACPEAASRFDLSALADNLELFSANARFVSAREVGDEGLVQVQIAERMPLRELRFQRRGGRWVYLPGPVGREILPLVREMTDALCRIAVVVAAGPHTEAQIEEEYRYRIGPRLKRIRQLGPPPESSGEVLPAAR